MKVMPLNLGFLKLDGGAMFGVVPKVIWGKLNPPDENNLCTWAMRCLLIEQGNKLILVDTGMGDKQDEKFFGHYGLTYIKPLELALQEKGYTLSDVTDVILTHLHFDHCGGAIAWNKDKTGYIPALPKAIYWSNKQHWQWATEPNAREKASFLKENILPIQESGQLKFIDEQNHQSLFENLSFYFVSGHTEKMMLPVLQYGTQKLIYMADLIASAAHIPIPYVMGYDTRPLLTLEEKSSILHQALKDQALLFFEHDPNIECCSIVQTEKGIRMGEAMPLSSLA